MFRDEYTRVITVPLTETIIEFQIQSHLRIWLSDQQTRLIRYSIKHDRTIGSVGLCAVNVVVCGHMSEHHVYHLDWLTLSRRTYRKMAFRLTPAWVSLHRAKTLTPLDLSVWARIMKMAYAEEMRNVNYPSRKWLLWYHHHHRIR